MNKLEEQIGRIKQLILVEQNIKDKVLLDGACKKWNTMSIEDKNKFTNNSTDILDQAKPIDMEVVCMATEEVNFEEALPNQKYREVVGMLVSYTL
jgi:hypothetical protein